MKKTIILLTATLAFTFASCGNATSEKETKQEDVHQNDETTTHDANDGHDHSADSTSHEEHNHAEGGEHKEGDGHQH